MWLQNRWDSPMGTSSGSNIHNQPQSTMLPPRQQPRTGGLQTSLSLVSSDGRASPDPQEPRSNSDQVRDSPSESASSRETWPTAEAVMGKKLANGKTDNDIPEQSVIRRYSNLEKLTLRDIARERVEMIAERMLLLPDELLEELKSRLRIILEGNGGSQHREEFLILQKLVQSRSDLTAKTLIRAHRVQLEILVAINTGIQGFLHPNISLSQTSLIEVFVYKRCRNIACQNQLPAEDCTCEVCTTRNGFCNLCMCVICNKFDFEVNTCRWIGCDLCSHWTHTDCAIRDVLICMGPSVKSGAGAGEMLFRCRACNRTSELLGWVKDVFQHCAPAWDREALMRELDFVSRIFRGSEDTRGRKLFWKCEELIEKMKGGVPESAACRVILMLFQGTYYAKHFDNLSYCIILCGEICYLEKKSLSISLLLFFLIFNGSQFTYHWKVAMTAYFFTYWMALFLYTRPWNMLPDIEFFLISWAFCYYSLVLMVGKKSLCPMLYCMLNIE